MSEHVARGFAEKLGSLLCLLLCSLLACPAAQAQTDSPAAPVKLVEVKFKSPDRPPVVGELIAENARYGLLILDADGQLIPIPPSAASADSTNAEPSDSQSADGAPSVVRSQGEDWSIASITELSGELIPTPPKDLAAKVLGSMPQGWKSIPTEHFVVCYNTSDVYARWNASLYERMYKGMARFWKEKGLDIHKPRFPLVALIFANRDEYLNYAQRDFTGAENTYGYYTQLSNRLATFDLTGIEGMIPPGYKVQREELITEIFSRPQAERQVATILHEACHQIAFNTGVQQRLGDYPLWVSEGIATFFESPDFSSPSGWGGTGKVNRYNLSNLRAYAPQRPPDSLLNLLVQDKLLRQAQTTDAAYGESWGLTFFLIKQRPKQYVEYLRLLGSRPPGNPSDSKQRMADFRKCFGDDLDKLDKEFVRFIGKLP